MEEIKETKTKKIIKFLLDHIMVISAIIFLCVLLFSSCSTAKASDSYEYKEEEYFNSCLEYFVELYGGNETLLNSMKTNLNYNMDFVFLEKDSVTYPNGDLKYCVIFTDSNPYVCYPLSRSRSSSLNSGLTTNNASVWVDAGYQLAAIPCNMYYLIQNKYGQISFYKTYYYNIGGNSQVSWANNMSDTTYFGSSTFTLRNMSSFCLSYNHYNYGADRQYELYGLPEYQLEQYSTDITELIPFRTYTEDNRLKIYSVNDVTGERSVIFDLDDFNFSNYSGNDAATQNTLYNNQISVTVDYDGTEQTFILDNTNSDILPAYLIETHYSFFNIGEYSNVKITKVEFSKLIHYMPSEMRDDEIENYYISCEYYLKRPESAPEASDIPYNSDVDNTKITQLQIDEKNEIINYDNGYYSPSGGGGDPLIVPDGYTVKLITVTGSDTLASILNDIYNGRYILNGLSGIYQFADDVVDYITGINSTDQFIEFMEDSIKNNNYSLLYDFVVYYWAPDASLSEPDVMYYYLTNSGKLRTINKTLADIWKESNQVSVNTGSLYDYLKERFDDFENQTLEQIYGNNKLVEKSNEWLQTINNTLSNLSFSDPFDDSDLLDKLDYVISILDDIAGFFSGDSNEGYSKFTKWIEEIEDDGEITPHEWANEIFNYVTGLYHSISDGTAFYTNDIIDYINYVNQNGTSDPGNYFFAMLEGTYDPHRYNGWTGGS